ncbi:MAG: NAD(P)/FAD-dependent oxidoreductase [Kiloniellaceae bacterium]
MATELFTPDFKATPYWWERSPRPDLGRTPLPAAVDVAIIGSGYTGLCAALEVARAGRSTLVLDAEDAGWGCSTRNGGQISTSIKPDYETLARRHGSEAAFAIVKEGQNALAWIGDFVAGEGIGCDFKVPGRFHAAHSPRQYERLARAATNQPKGLEVPAYAVPRAEQRRELGTDAYHGGVVFEKHACLDPGRFHEGLLARVLGAGAAVVSHCTVAGIEGDGSGHSLTTRLGNLRAREVIVATNGYTGTVTPWLHRRVIPIGSYMIATEPLAKDVMGRVMPTDRIVSDSRKVVYYYRPSPDRSRILFGGRVTSGETDPRSSGRLLRRELVRLFPELAAVRVSHSWMGLVAYTFDTLAHLGSRDGIHYAMGYCGSGVSMASYLGTRVGQKVLGRGEGRTALDDVRFQTRPLYTGRPWFLAPSVAFYRWRDALGL